MALLGREIYAENIKLLSLDGEVKVPISEYRITRIGVSPRLNFDEFGGSLITVFALLVNEDWNYVLYTYVKCGESGPIVGYIYIMFVVVFGNFILL